MNTALRIAHLEDVATIDRTGIAATDIESGTPYIGLEHIEAGGRILSAIPVENGELASNKFTFTSRHVLYGKLRPYLAKIATPDFSGICSTDIVPILPGPNLDRSYLTHFLRQPSMVAYATSRSEGINLPRLSPRALARFEIPLPSLEEQRRIAAILDKADALRQKRKRAIALLGSLTQSIFLEMFGVPGDITTSATPQLPLGELAQLINGDRSNNYPSGDEIVSSGVLFLNTTNLTREGLDLKSANYITERKFASLTRGKLAPGDIVITLRGSLGQTAIFENAGETGFINAQMMIIRAGDKIDTRYLLQALQLDSTLAHFKKIGSGSAVPQLTGKQMSELLIPLPELNQQRLFAARKSSLLRTRQIALQNLNLSEHLFASLQNRAFVGEL